MKFPSQFPPHRWSPLYGCSVFCQLPHGLFSQRCFNNIVFFSRVFPWYLAKTSCYCALSNPFLTPFIKVLQQYQQENSFPFITCTFFTLANNICQTQRCPFTFYLLSVQTFLWHLLTKRKQSFERNLRQREREQWEMYYGISHFNRKVNFLSYLAHFLPSPIIFAEHNSALLLFIYCLSKLSFDIFWQKEDKV